VLTAGSTEMDAHRAQLKSDVRGLVNQDRTIFGWDVPEVDEPLSERLIVKALRRALEELASEEVPAHA
jgi:hypothetical protein